MSITEDDPGLGRRPVRPGRMQAGSGKGNMIASILEGDVIPGLLRNYAVSMPAHAGPGAGGASFESEALLLSESLLGWRADAPQRIMEDLRGRGGHGARVAEAVLGETARRLGEMWVEDRCSFFQVSLAMSELQTLLRASRPEAAGIGAVTAGNPGGKVVLATAPGEQHSFGISVLEVAFAEAGWTTTTMIGQPFSSLSNLLGQASFDVVALSCSCSGLLDGLKSAIGTLRRASLNQHVKVLVGGHLESQVEYFAERVGADASAGDIESALAAANSLLAQHREPAHEQAR